MIAGGQLFFIGPGEAPAKPLLLPPTPWPPWALALKEKALPSDRGLGDVAARVIGPFGSPEFRTWYSEATSIWNPQCRCETWQPLWNELWPLPPFR